MKRLVMYSSKAVLFIILVFVFSVSLFSTAASPALQQPPTVTLPADLQPITASNAAKLTFVATIDTDTLYALQEAQPIVVTIDDAHSADADWLYYNIAANRYNGLTPSGKSVFNTASKVVLANNLEDADYGR